MGAVFVLSPPEDSVVGKVLEELVQEGDTLPDLAARYDLGYEEILLANPKVDPWYPGVGNLVRLPLVFVLPDVPREGIVLNLSEMRLYYYPKAHSPTVMTYPIGIGREGWDTPLGLTKIVKKDANPAWVPPESIRKEHLAEGDPLPVVVPAGPDNPLGPYALRLGFLGYLLHGSNKPYGFGMRVSHGCIRLPNKDVEELFRIVPVGTPVRIIDEPYKLGQSGNTLWVEAHPPLRNAEEARRAFLQKLAKESQRLGVRADEAVVRQELEAPSGIPRIVGRGGDTPLESPPPGLPAVWASAGGKGPAPRKTDEDDMDSSGTASPDGNSPRLQVGVFALEDNAKTLAQEISHYGIPAKAHPPAGKDPFWRVVAGPFSDMKSAQEARSRLLQAGIRSFFLSPAL